MLKKLGLMIVFGSLLGLQSVVAQEKSAALNDAQIAMVAVTANKVDIDAGKLAEKRGHSQAVKNFGEMMVRDHTSVNEKATALVKKLGVTPEESETSKGLKAQGEATLKRLKGLKGDAFDKAYIDNEVTYHQSVIAMLENQLIPNTKNAELKNLLVSAGPVFHEHLNHAKEIQTSLNK